MLLWIGDRSNHGGAIDDLSRTHDIIFRVCVDDAIVRTADIDAIVWAHADSSPLNDCDVSRLRAVYPAAHLIESRGKAASLFWRHRDHRVDRTIAWYHLAAYVRSHSNSFNSHPNDRLIAIVSRRRKSAIALVNALLLLGYRSIHVTDPSMLSSAGVHCAVWPDVAWGRLPPPESMSPAVHHIAIVDPGEQGEHGKMLGTPVVGDQWHRVLTRPIHLDGLAEAVSPTSPIVRRPSESVFELLQ